MATTSATGALVAKAAALLLLVVSCGILVSLHGLSLTFPSFPLTKLTPAAKHRLGSLGRPAAYRRQRYPPTLSSAPVSRRSPRVLPVANNRSYDEAFAKHLMRFNAAAGCPPAMLFNWACSRCNFTDGFDELTVTSVDLDGEYSLRYDDYVSVVGVVHRLQLIVVTLRGTKDNDIFNWISDADVKHVLFLKNQSRVPLYRDTWVHRGAHFTWSLLRPWTVGNVTRYQAKYPHYTMVLTGHSLGGAMANMYLGEILAQQSPVPLTHFYTFGAFRTGDLRFAEAQAATAQRRNITTWRVVNKDDPVPHLVMEMYGYRHLNTEAWLRKDGSTTICDSSGEDPRCSNSIPTPETWLHPGDHTSYFGLNAGPCFD